jgi:hypothetical protein
MNDGESWNELEMARVQGGYGITKVKRRDTDQKIRKGDNDALCRLFAFDSSGKFGNFKGHRLYRNGAAELFHEGAPALGIRIRPRAIDAVG